jgi:glycosyltransferase involved in cell wall biosynthesis
VSEVVPEETTQAAGLAGLAELRRVAIVPALNEEATVPGVIDELRAFDPGLDVVVVDDGSSDRTAEIAAATGARVLRLPFNLGIGGAVQTGFRYAFEQGYDLAVRVDGDGQHDPGQLARVLEPVLRGAADIAVGSRFAADEKAGYRSSRSRRIGIRILAGVVSRIVGERVTDTTSGFQVLNRRGIALFAHDYPHDYPEVEATVMVFRHRLRLVEVPVAMRQRGGGASSITALRSIYYMVKVLLAIFVGLFRRTVVPEEVAWEDPWSPSGRPPSPHSEEDAAEGSGESVVSPPRAEAERLPKEESA